MFTKYYIPHPALQEFVEIICIMEHDFSTDVHMSPIYTFMPTHTRFLCFYLDEPVKVKKGNGEFRVRSRSIIIGPQLTPVTLDFGKKHVEIVVVLKPCGLYRFLGIPLNEIVDLDFDASLIVGKEIDHLIERLINSQDPDKRINIIQDYLLAKLNSLKIALPIDSAMMQLVKSQGNLSMDSLVSQSCIGIRQLERQSLERIGLPPKFFAKMIRFSEAYKYKERNPQATWTEISHLFGYHDQMHLIRDFRQFTGVNPSTVNTENLANSVKLSSFDV